MNNQNYSVDTSGNITSAQPVTVNDIITRITGLQTGITDSQNSITTFQAEITSLVATLVQVAQAPGVDPDILATLQAIPVVASLLS